MRTCVFDQSSKKTGYAFFDNSNLTRWGLLDYSKDKDVDIRIQEMSQKINTIIEKSRADIVVFEDVNQRNNIKTLITLSHLQGMIMYSCYMYNKEFVIYSPSTWRRIIGIQQGSKVKRESLKEQAIAFVRQAYGIAVGDDIAESICIGLAYLKDHNMLTDYKITKKENSKNG